MKTFRLRVRSSPGEREKLTGYIGKVMFFMILTFPVFILLLILGLPDWSAFTVWSGLGVIGRETAGRRIDRMDDGDRRP